MKKREIYGGSGRGILVGVSHLKRDGFGMYAFGKQKGEKSFGMYAFGKPVIRGNIVHGRRP